MVTARMPTFVVIGAAKCGTTACYFHLKAHPEIFMSPIKEPHFFAFDGTPSSYRTPHEREWARRSILDLEAYRRLFDGATTERALGEASSLYLSIPGSAERIRARVPEARLVAILRDPADRAYSHFLHFVRQGAEHERDFLAALDTEPARIRDDLQSPFQYAARGLYHRYLSRFYAVFPREQIRVFLYEDFRGDTASTLRDLYAFVGASPDFVPPLDGVYNPSGVPKSPLLFAAYQRLGAVARAAERRGLIPSRLLDSGLVARSSMAFHRRVLTRPHMPDEARARLRAFCREDTLALEELIGRDLSHWMS